ncbi:MAG: hypothetical protein HYT72_03215 [Candidatus Aenigmarchaeota archaeon]|nr:hypothetical protein [Candidatus Aenigmarchaeota archaeon]
MSEFIRDIRRNFSHDFSERPVSAIGEACLVFSLPLYLMTGNTYAGGAAAISSIITATGYVLGR